MIEITNYTIENELGRGWMATVYLAVQDMLNRHVALNDEAKKIAEANRRKQQLARSKAHKRVFASLNGGALKTSFVLNKNGKHVQTISGKANANSDVPTGRYTFKAQYGGQVGNAAVNVGIFETAVQRFAFRTSEAAKAPIPPKRDVLDPKWEYEHVLPSLSQ